jgi:hypothetical protein
MSYNPQLFGLYEPTFVCPFEYPPFPSFKVAEYLAVAFVAAKGFDVLPALHAYLHSLRVGIRNVKPVREESFDRKSLQAE